MAPHFDDDVSVAVLCSVVRCCFVPCVSGVGVEAWFFGFFLEKMSDGVDFAVPGGFMDTGLVGVVGGLGQC